MVLFVLLIIVDCGDVIIEIIILLILCVISFEFICLVGNFIEFMVLVLVMWVISFEWW